MSSAPSFSHMLASPSHHGKLTHLHRRSGAVSGNFDAVGLGLFSPPPTITQTTHHSAHSLNPNTLSLAPSSASDIKMLSFLKMFQPGSESDVLDRQFNFCNEEDFSNKPVAAEFEFPQKAPSSAALPLLVPSSCSPPRFVSGGSHLFRSPICLRNRKSMSSMNATPKHFLIHETNFDKNNMPDALIDLDEILRHTSALLERSQSVHSSEQHALPESVEEAGLFCQPRSLPQLLPPTYSYLPFSSPAYLKQPLREPTDRAIEEEDDIEETALDYPESSTTQLFSGDYHDSANGGRTTATNSGLYEISVNSSNSSLPSIEVSSQRSVLAHPLEKSYSNSSRESALSGLGFIRNNSLTHNSGAKATRYQIFCEQSLNISSAIKNMSSENVNLQASSVSNTPTSSYELALLSPNSLHSLPYHEDSLGHSSNMSLSKLPCLTEKRARNVPAGILGNSGTGNTFDSRTREFPKHPYTTTIRMHDAELRGGSPVTAHDFPYGINLKEIICQTVNEKPKRVTFRKFLPVPSSANKCRANDNSLSPLSENTDNVSTESVGDHGSDHSSLASQPEILQQSTKRDVISRNVTHVQDLEVTKCETYVKALDDRTSPIHVRETGLTNLTQPKSFPAISVLSPKVLPTHKKVPQESRIPPRKTFDLTRATSENIKKNADSVLNLQVGSNSRIRAKEHKRTGSGHRLLSNWLKKCA